MSDVPVQSLALPLSHPFARQLLDSARADSPEPGARDRALLVLGLAPVGLLAITPPAAAAAAAASSPAGALALSSKAVPWMVGKSLAIGLFGSVVALSGLDRALDRSAQPTAVTVPSAASTATITAPGSGPATASSALVVPTSAPSVASPAPTFTPSDEEKPAEVSRPAIEAAASTPSVALPSNSLLELEALARVRRALSAHESARALWLLDDFARSFPASQVAEEALVLRIETLRALGRTSEAQALRLRFLRDRPSSVYATKVRAMTQIGDQPSNRGH